MVGEALLVSVHAQNVKVHLKQGTFKCTLNMCAYEQVLFRFLLSSGRIHEDYYHGNHDGGQKDAFTRTLGFEVFSRPWDVPLSEFTLKKSKYT